MTDTAADGQDALRLLARATRALVEEGRISTAGLLPAWRTLAPRSHAHAKADALDLAAIVRWRAIGGDALLRAKTILVDAAAPRTPMRASPAPKPAGNDVVTLHAPATDHAAGDALATALGLALESAKLAHGLRAPDDAVRAAFATPNDAKTALESLARGGDEREVVLASSTPARVAARVDARSLALVVGDRPAYLVCGAGAWRVHDLLSPFARRLRTELAAVASARGAYADTASNPALRRASDDDVYAGVDALYADPSSSAAWSERIAVEKSEGFVPCGDGCIVVKCESIPDDVDRRAREAAVLLKRARAALILVEPQATSLTAALLACPQQLRALAIVVEASAACTPAFVRDIASSHTAPVANAFENAAGVLTTVPSLDMTSELNASSAVDDVAFSLVQCALSAQAAGALAPSTKIALRAVPVGDVAVMSRACLEVLSRLGPKKGR